MGLRDSGQKCPWVLFLRRPNIERRNRGTSRLPYILLLYWLNSIKHNKYAGMKLNWPLFCPHTHESSAPVSTEKDIIPDSICFNPIKCSVSRQMWWEWQVNVTVTIKLFPLLFKSKVARLSRDDRDKLDTRAVYDLQGVNTSPLKAGISLMQFLRISTGLVSLLSVERMNVCMWNVWG